MRPQNYFLLPRKVLSTPSAKQGSGAKQVYLLRALASRAKAEKVVLSDGVSSLQSASRIDRVSRSAMRALRTPECWNQEPAPSSRAPARSLANTVTASTTGRGEGIRARESESGTRPVSTPATSDAAPGDMRPAPSRDTLLHPHQCCERERGRKHGLASRGGRRCHLRISDLAAMVEDTGRAV